MNNLFRALKQWQTATGQTQFYVTRNPDGSGALTDGKTLALGWRDDAAGTRLLTRMAEKRMTVKVLDEGEGR